MSRRYLWGLAFVTALMLSGCSQPKQATEPSPRRQMTSALKTATEQNRTLADQVDDVEATIQAETEQIAALESAAQSAPTAKTTHSAKAPTSTASPAAATDTAKLAAMNFAGQQEIPVANNAPGFTTAELSTAKGAWEAYTDLDGLNRAVAANALLSTALMPTDKREGLTWDPTGWRNKRTAHGWLYNRSHLIGFQLSGENNNPKNLITGTQSLNNPLMLAHEMDIATYLKADAHHFVRYQVRPIYRGNDLVARGVQMRAQSIGDNTIRFNVYIFNVEAGYTINYADGTSTAN
ncbi:DNA/RNA non-specific endonuclease [Lacticaseibacillus absianus]|uniref:DNA/RNA non-specific endonuclease n=1 Tax=Lacticaseibacillus absianus TaxID=2729623 RepID=UPI0031B64AB0